MTEDIRLSALKATKLLDSEAEERFDRITRMASTALGTEVALISLIDENRQWFKSKQGTDLCETDREFAFCDHAIRQDNVMVVPDATKDERFVANPLVTDGPEIRFYAGAPLVTKDGHALGTLCVIDSQPRHNFSAEDQQLLKDLAVSIMTEIEVVKQTQVIADYAVINEELRHRMGNMYAHVSALISMMGRNEDDKDKLVRRLRERITNLGQTQALFAAHKWASVPMSKLVKTTLEPFINSGNQERITIQSTQDFDVSPRGAFILTLMLSELGTNAVKHGALGPREGQLSIGWRTGDIISLEWDEILNDGVSGDLGAGFGSQILKRIVPMDLQGEASYNLMPNGLKYHVTANPERLRI
ncbi:GAF domain-containing protein [Litorimonas sp. RW-G-Af-16]|uniref:GAF domain-containing protein n=1 Tax=Litorimonas sp. RW-G-Af-16 TaxID=3241168 RepID=UPI00390CAA3A